mgnify:CR=1 FL=1
MTFTVTNKRTGRPVAGATVYLDGVPVGKTDSKGKITIKGITPGCHTHGQEERLQDSSLSTMLLAVEHVVEFRYASVRAFC